MTEVIQLKLSLSNAFLVKGNRPILVDAGSPNEEDKIVAQLAKHGVRGEDLSLIVLTHGHIDHAGSAAALKKRFGTPIAVHSADVDMLTNGKNRPFQTIGLEAKLVNLFLSSTFPPVSHDLLLDESFELSQFGVAGQILHTPGHTAGSISVLLDDGNAIAGDILRGGYMGGNLQPTKPLYHYFAERFEQINVSLGKLIAAQSHTLHIGHGGPLDIAQIKQRFSTSLA